MLNRTKEEKIKLLNETVEYYSADPLNRICKTDEKCVYNPKTIGKEGTSEGCAVGRLLPPELSLKLDNDFNNVPVTREDLFDILPEDVKNYGRSFLGSLQQLHDSSVYWNSTGLSEAGRERVKTITQDINNEYY